MDGVSILDAGGLAALTKLIEHLQAKQCKLVITDLQFQPIRTLARARIQPIEGLLHFYPTLGDALEKHPH